MSTQAPMVSIKRFQPSRLLFSYLIAAAVQTITMMMYMPTPTPSESPALLANILIFFWLTPLTTIGLALQHLTLYHAFSIGIFGLIFSCGLLKSFPKTVVWLRAALALLLLGATLCISAPAFSLGIFGLIFAWSLLVPFPKTSVRLRVPALLLLVAATGISVWNTQRQDDCSIPGIAVGVKQTIALTHGHTTPSCRLDFGTGRWDHMSTSHRYYDCKSIAGEPGNLMDSDGSYPSSSPAFCRVYRDLR